MSLDNLNNQVGRIEKEIAEFHKKIADESRRELDKQKQIDSINRSISSSSSISSLESKQRQIRGYQSDLINIQGKKAELQKKLADKSSELNRKKMDLLNEEKRERQKIQREQENFQRKLQTDLSNQKLFLQSFMSSNQSFKIETSIPVNKEYDFFISHATEDKEEFVRPLAESLVNAGIKVWYDEHQLKIGDSLRKNIDHGLINSKFGIVVLSTAFFKKNWPEYELNGLVAREMNGVRVILPIWYKVTKDEVLSYSPILADKVALNSSLYTIKDIVEELKKLLNN